MTSSLLRPAGSLGFPNMGATPPIMAPGQMPTNTGIVPPQPAAVAHPGVDQLQARHDQMMSNAATQFGGMTQPPADGGAVPVNHQLRTHEPGAMAGTMAHPNRDNLGSGGGPHGAGLLDRLQSRFGGFGGFGGGGFGGGGVMRPGVDINALLARLGHPAGPPQGAPASIMAPTGPVPNQPAGVVY